MLQALVGRNGSGIFPELGDLHRVFVWENVLFKAGLQAKGVDQLGLTSDAPDLGLGSSQMGLDGGVVPSITNGDQSDTVSVSGTVSPKKEEEKKETSRSQNIKALSHVLNQIPSALTPLFQGTRNLLVSRSATDTPLLAVVKLFQTRRTPDAATKQRILEASDLLAHVILKHLALKVSGMLFFYFKHYITKLNILLDDQLSLFTYYTVMFGLLSVLLVEGLSFLF